MGSGLPVERRARTRVEVVEVLRYAGVEQIDEGNVVDFFVEAVAAEHEDEDHEAEGKDEADGLED
jgi:hypothetical protein